MAIAKDKSPVVETLQRHVQFELTSTMSDIVKEVNNGLESIIFSTLKHAETLEQRLAKYFFEMKTSLLVDTSQKSTAQYEAPLQIKHVPNRVKTRKLRSNKNVEELNSNADNVVGDILPVFNYKTDKQRLDENNNMILDSFDEDSTEQILTPFLKQEPKIGDSAYKKLDNGKFSCDDCQYTTPYKKDLVKHVVAVQGRKDFTCEDCNFATARKSNLSRHIASIHSN